MAPRERSYHAGFGNDFSSESLPGALPPDQNTPQKPPYGLYVEELNGTAFTAPRGVSRSTWTYRIRPSAVHKPFRQISNRLVRSGPFNEVPPTPNQMRWRPLPIPSEPTDFVDGIVNATPVGMTKYPGSPLPPHLLRHDLWVADIVYFPAETELLRAADTFRMLTAPDGMALQRPPTLLKTVRRISCFEISIFTLRSKADGSNGKNFAPRTAFVVSS